MELHGKIIELNEGLMARDLTFFGRSQGGGQILVELWYYKRTPMFGGRLAPTCNYMIGFSCISTHEYNRNVSHVSMEFAGNIHVCTSLSVYPYLLLVNSPTRTASWTVQLVCDDPGDWQCGLGDYPIFFGGMRQIQQVLVQFSALLYFVTTGHTRKQVLVVSKLVNNLPSALLYTPKRFSDLESQQNHSKS